jgi:catechol 2,3-dioxygenase-like lactoylglutathione lyase family enzyme
MSNVHIHLHVSDLEASRVFYQRFLGAEPVKVKPGYVKFLPAFAPINLALSAGEAAGGSATCCTPLAKVKLARGFKQP